MVTLKHLPVLLLLLLVACGGRVREEDNRPFVYFRNYSRTFNDMHEKHLAAATLRGITPIASAAEVGNATRPLKKITSCSRYHVDKLSHSIPYLVPEARDLLEEIAENFQDSLKAKRLPPHALIVTSLLRATDDAERLRARNGNASARSAHLFATTFDIAHARYKPLGKQTAPVDKLKSVLAGVLLDLRSKGRCHVRYEYKQICFHVTVR
ncbi:MAG: DUF5715 family protein [Odoribacteraceae bacterium]|jgi:hypothetical protein|nr:DUF5715 family protein [Odoribacteraceae bacterium]